MGGYRMHVGIYWFPYSVQLNKILPVQSHYKVMLGFNNTSHSVLDFSEESKKNGIEMNKRSTLMDISSTTINSGRVSLL